MNGRGGEQLMKVSIINSKDNLIIFDIIYEKPRKKGESNSIFIEIEIIYSSILRYDIIKRKYYLLHKGEINRIIRYDHEIREDDYNKLIKERRKDVDFIEYYNDKKLELMNK